MSSGFVRSKKISAFILFSVILGLSSQNMWCSTQKDKASYNLENNAKANEQIENQEKLSHSEKHPYLTTAERTIVKTLVRSFWGTIKPKTDFKDMKFSDTFKKIDLYKLAIVYSDLLLDELLPKSKTTNMYQKVSEVLLPTIASTLIIELGTKPMLSKEDYNLTTKKIGHAIDSALWKSLIKLGLVRFFQTPGTTNFKVANIASLGLSFADRNSQNNYNIKQGVENMALDQIKMLIESQDFGTTLNQKHRKKVIWKTVHELIKPLLKYIIQNG